MQGVGETDQRPGDFDLVAHEVLQGIEEPPGSPDHVPGGVLDVGDGFSRRFHRHSLPEFRSGGVGVKSEDQLAVGHPR